MLIVWLLRLFRVPFSVVDSGESPRQSVRSSSIATPTASHFDPHLHCFLSIGQATLSCGARASSVQESLAARREYLRSASRYGVLQPRNPDISKQGKPAFKLAEMHSSRSTCARTGQIMGVRIICFCSMREYPSYSGVPGAQATSLAIETTKHILTCGLLRDANKSKRTERYCGSGIQLQFEKPRTKQHCLDSFHDIDHLSQQTHTNRRQNDELSFRLEHCCECSYLRESDENSRVDSVPV